MIKTTKNMKSTELKTKAVSNKPTPVEAVKTAVAAKPVAKPVAKPASRISLELVKSEAKEVYVAGSFNGWVPQKSPLSHAGNGRWVGDLAVGPGRYEYLFVVDGQWLPDPNARETVDNPFGGKNSVLLVSE
jgi:1,4-alpha-glucan branching enzyme